MIKYGVTIPISGQIYVEIESEESLSLEEIFDQACSVASTTSLEYLDYELDFYKQIVEGNVFHGMKNRWSYERWEEDDE